MALVKHPLYGNMHIDKGEIEKYVAEGWVVWPRTKAQKEAVSRETFTPRVSELPVFPIPAPAEPMRTTLSVKRK